MMRRVVILLALCGAAVTLSSSSSHIYADSAINGVGATPVAGRLTASAVPEPASVLLLGAGLLALAARLRRGWR
jgi:hypothetical protein